MSRIVLTREGNKMKLTEEQIKEDLENESLEK